MCRKGAWAELTVRVTPMACVRSKAHGQKRILRPDSDAESGRLFPIKKLCNKPSRHLKLYASQERQKGFSMTPDEKYMKEALRQAKKAYALKEVPIGCVIVYEDQIIARGYNRRNTDQNTTSHAEINAIRKASKKMGDWRLEGCTIYITLEPCQMCAGAIVQSRIDRVVIASMNPKAGCAGSVLNLLEMQEFNHQCEVTRGVLQEECSTMLSGFFRELRELKRQKKLAEGSI